MQLKLNASDETHRLQLLPENLCWRELSWYNILRKMAPEWALLQYLPSSIWVCRCVCVHYYNDPDSILREIKLN